MTTPGRASDVRSLAAHVVHEFETPLAATHGATELLAEHGNIMSEEEHTGFAEAIEDGAMRLDRLVRGVLDLARADVTMAGERTSLHPADEAARSVQVAATVFDNLISNELAQAASSRSAVGKECQETVADERLGFLPVNAARAFDPFLTTARSVAGAGLASSALTTANPARCLGPHHQLRSAVPRPATPPLRLPPTRSAAPRPVRSGADPGAGESAPGP